MDSSAFLAVIFRDDRYHREAKAAGARPLAGHYRLFSTMYTVVEAHASILRAVNARVGREFLLHSLEDVTLLPVRMDEEKRARDLVLQRLDKQYSLCDAISFAVMDRYEFHLAFAIDDHFRQHGFSTPINQENWP